MKRATVIGVYGKGIDFTTGQAVKCIELIDWLERKYGANEIYVVNTYNWKKNPIKLFFQLFKGMFISRNIILMPAQNGLKIFAPIVKIINIVTRKQIHYVVIGGWLENSLKENKFLFNIVRDFSGIYVELKSMMSKLEQLGLENVIFMPNSRRKTSVADIRRNYSKVCTYSRITEEKGIEDAIEIVKLVNKNLGSKQIFLDVYGQIDEAYKTKFFRLVEENNGIVEYRGVKGPTEGVKTVAEYFCLLFPTYYHGEGLAGTILDAFASGTPIISNDWKYNSEIIEDGKTGFIYPYRDIIQAAKILTNLYGDLNLHNSISKKCYKEFDNYDVDIIMEQFCKRLS